MENITLCLKNVDVHGKKKLLVIAQFGYWKVGRTTFFLDFTGNPWKFTRKIIF